MVGMALLHVLCCFTLIQAMSSASTQPAVCETEPRQPVSILQHALEVESVSNCRECTTPQCTLSNPGGCFNVARRALKEGIVTLNLLIGDFFFGANRCSSHEHSQDKSVSNSVAHVWVVFADEPCPNRIPAMYDCSLESSARAKMNTTVWIFHESNTCPTVQNLHYRLASLPVSNHTRLGQWYYEHKKDLWHTSKRALLSNLARYFLLSEEFSQHGGTYLDLDMLILRDDFNDLPSMVASQVASNSGFSKYFGGHRYNGAAIRVGKESHLAKTLASEFRHSWTRRSWTSEYVWGDFGPALITRVVARMRLYDSCDVSLLSLKDFENYAIHSKEIENLRKCQSSPETEKLAHSRCPQAAARIKDKCKQGSS